MIGVGVGGKFGFQSYRAGVRVYRISVVNICRDAGNDRISVVAGAADGADGDDGDRIDADADIGGRRGGKRHRVDHIDRHGDRRKSVTVRRDDEHAVVGVGGIPHGGDADRARFGIKPIMRGDCLRVAADAVGVRS